MNIQYSTLKRMEHLNALIFFLALNEIHCWEEQNIPNIHKENFDT